MAFASVYGWRGHTTEVEAVKGKGEGNNCKGSGLGGQLNKTKKITDKRIFACYCHNFAVLSQLPVATRVAVE